MIQIKEKEINITPHQQKAIDDVLKWIKKKKVMELDYLKTLAGAAGTGKSTITKQIIDEASKTKKVAVTAPTHKAKEVIADKTGRTAETIQSLLGLRPDVNLEDFDPNNPIFDQLAEERIKHYTMIVIDESSMLNKDAFNMIKEKAFQYQTLILFVGDKYQLPPINEQISKVFELENVTYLTEIIRQKGTNPNIQLLDVLRDDVVNSKDHALKTISSIKINRNEDEGYEVLGKEVFYERLMEFYYNSEFDYNPDYIKTLCYTNVAAGRINNYIRQKLVPSRETVAKGDTFMGYKGITIMQAGGHYQTIIVNSKDYKVENVEIIEKEIHGVILKLYDTKFVDVAIPIMILHRDSYDTFIEEYRIKLNTAKSRVRDGWKTFYNFKNNIITMENIVDKNGVFVCSKDIDYGYAITVHKSQGSTYDNVAVFINDIRRCSNARDRRSLMYVALSRTSKLNLIYNG